MNGRAAGECLSNGGQPERRDVASKPSREVLESKGEPGTPTKLWDLKVVSLPVSCEPTVCWDLVQLLRPSFCTMGQEGTLFWTSGRGNPYWKPTQRESQGRIWGRLSTWGKAGGGGFSVRAGDNLLGPQRGCARFFCPECGRSGWGRQSSLWLQPPPPRCPPSKSS